MQRVIAHRLLRMRPVTRLTRPYSTDKVPVEQETTTDEPATSYALKAKKLRKKAGAKEDKRFQRIAMTVTGLGTLAGAGLFAYLGRPYDEYETQMYRKEDSTDGYLERAKTRFSTHYSAWYFANPAWDKLLPDPLPEPYGRPYTLVINVDDTLVHSEWDVQHGWRFAKRPGVDYFLAYLSQFYEIVVFTSMQSFNAQPLLDKLDPIGYTMYRLYREATTYDDTKYIKDLSKLNRDLSKVIIMDSNPDAYSLQPENAVAVPPWTGDPNDRYLTEIIPFLETLVIMNVADVRPICQKYYGQDTPQKFAETEARIRDQLRAQWEEQKSKTSVKGLFGMFGSVQKHEQGEPPVPLIEKQRRQLHEAFEKEHARAHTEALQQAQQFQKDQEKAMKEMKLTVWDLVTKGPPQPGLGMDSKS